MTKGGEHRALNKEEAAAFLGNLTFKALYVLIALAIISVVQMFRLGVSNRYILLLIGSVFSFIILFCYPMTHFRFKRGSSAAFTLSIAGFIPYLFGCYLAFYEGFWRLQALLDGFSDTIIIIALLYIVGGYAVVSAIYKVSEFVRALDEGRIKIGDE